MTVGLENLQKKDYPGRVIIIGKDSVGKNVIIIYAVTGRSPSSQARKIEASDKAIWVKPTDEDKINEGNRDLLIYPAILYGGGIAVSNGKQTTSIKEVIDRDQNPVTILSRSLENWEYEPDEPVYTPRISGCVLTGEKAALSILKRSVQGACLKSYFEFPLLPGKGKLIATYQGENRDPLPSFPGEPFDVELRDASPEAVAESVYRALGPAGEKKDFRVAAACLFSENLQSGSHDVFIINRHERDIAK